MRLHDEEIELMELPEQVIKAIILFPFVLILLGLGVGVGIWIGRMCDMILECVVTGVVISQTLVVLGTCKIIKFGHGHTKEKV